MTDPVPLHAIFHETLRLVPGSRDELAAFAALQARLPKLFEKVFPNPQLPRTVVVVPSISFDMDVMAKIAGGPHYEERLLCLLMLLRMPRTKVIYLTSLPIADEIIDYYLHLLPGVPPRHARSRMTLLACDDASARPLTAKLLERPRLLERVRETMGDPELAHLACFNVTHLERTLAVELGAPIFGCDPALLHLGSKSGGRKIFRETGVPLADGVEDIADETGLVEALCALKGRNRALRRAVVKLDEGFSGEGNAMFSFAGCPQSGRIETWVKNKLPEIACEAKDMKWEAFSTKFKEMKGVAEAFIEGKEKRSPSAQFRADPNGVLERLSTHDQVLGGPTGQVYLGCTFPADEAYRVAVQEEGAKAAEALRKRGVWGRFAIDFISVREGTGWKNYAIEINLRKGGTTHPFLMLEFLTNGKYEASTGVFRTRQGSPRSYYATDNLVSERYIGLTPADLIDIAVLNGLHFDATTQEGVMFHLIGALSGFGKIGVVCVAGTAARATALYQQAVSALDAAVGAA
ncbi:MAG: peptide ligase PGM1-related protein [Alphaproteobacteria bacterium]